VLEMAQKNVQEHVDTLLVGTSIKILKSTAKRLADLGKKGETYDDIIVKLLNRCERKKAQKE